MNKIGQKSLKVCVCLVEYLRHFQTAVLPTRSI